MKFFRQRRQEKLDDELIKAVRHGRLSKVEFFLAHGADPNCPRQGYGAFQALSRYFYEGNDGLDILDRLIAAGLDINRQDDHGNTPLIQAASIGNWQVFDRLLDEAPDLLKINNNEISVLHVLFDKRAWDRAIRVMDQGALNIPPPEKNGLTLLHFSLPTMFRDDILQRILDAPSFDVNYVHPNCLPVLHQAIKHKSALAYKLIGHPRTDVNLVYAGKSPLHTAIENGFTVAAEKLALRGADPIKKDSDGKTPLVLAAEGESVRLLRLIIEGLSAAGTDYRHEYTQALFGALEKGNVRIIEMLIEAGADVNAAGERGKTPLMLAIHGDKKEVFDLLRRSGARIDARDAEGMTVRDHAGACHQGKFLAFLDEATPAKTNGRFVKHSDDVIEVCDGPGLSTVFNFATQQLIYRDGTSMNVQNFAAVQRKQAIIDAFNQLKNMGGKPQDPGLAMPEKNFKTLR